MNPESRDQWINEILNEVFLAVIAWEPLRNALIFKGARILNLHLGDSRQSLDIDSNIAPELVASTPNLAAQASFLEEQIPPALRRHFERQNPVKYKLGRVNVVGKPPKGHLRGWDAFLLRIEVQDNSMAGVRGLPMLEIDVAAPETLGPDAVQTITVKGIPAKVYALHQFQPPPDLHTPVALAVGEENKAQDSEWSSRPNGIVGNSGGQNATPAT